MTSVLVWSVVAAAFVAAAPEQKPLTIGVENSLTKVFRDEPFHGARGDALRLQMARNEYEAGQLVLIAGSRRLEHVRVGCTDLLHKNGKHEIDRKHVHLNFVGYTVPTAIRSKGVLKNRKLEPSEPKPYPDPRLLDRTITIEPKRVQPVWVTVYAPPEAAAGDYSGEMAVYNGKQQIGTVRLEVHVWDFTLPDAVPLYVWYYNDFNSFARNWLGVTQDDWERYKTAFRHYVREIVRHRGSITPPLDYTAGRRFEEIVRIMTEEGCRYWWVTWFWRGDAYVNRPEAEQRQPSNRGAGGRPWREDQSSRRARRGRRASQNRNRNSQRMLVSLGPSLTLLGGAAAETIWRCLSGMPRKRRTVPTTWIAPAGRGSPTFWRAGASPAAGRLPSEHQADFPNGFRTEGPAMSPQTNDSKSRSSRRTFLKATGALTATAALAGAAKARGAQEPLALHGGSKTVTWPDADHREAYRWPLYGPEAEEAVVKLVRRHTYEPIALLEKEWSRCIGSDCLATWTRSTTGPTARGLSCWRTRPTPTGPN